MRRLLAALIALALLAAAQPPTPADAEFDALAADTRAQMLADPGLAVRQAEQARDYAERRPAGPQRDLMVATATWLMGEAYTRIGRNDRARPLIEAAVERAAAIAPKSRLLADALLSRGSLHAADGAVAKAMSDLHAAHDLFRDLGESRGRARAFAQIANLYYDANDWNNALKYFGQALDVHHADPGLAVSVYNGRGVALLELKRSTEALRDFSQALAIARELKSPFLTATILKNVARARLANHRPTAAEDAIKESIALAHGKAPPEFIRRQVALLGQVAFERHDLARAERLVTQAFAGVDLRRTELADREAHKTAYDTFRAVGRDGLALEHLTALKRLDDEATELARSNGAALMAARFDYSNQELRIEKLKADDLRKSVAYERTRARTQQMLMLGGTGATIVLVGVLAFALLAVRRSRDRVAAANVDLEQTNGALEKALAAKTEFLATTSHEIRTPLNGILGMTQVMLADPRTDAATRDRVSVVHGAGVTMRALVDDILDVAKMETGNLTIEECPFDLCRTLSESTRIWDEQARAKGLVFAVELQDCPAGIMGDPARLRQIVFNLLANALKFTPTGSVVLRAARRGDRYEIAVRDTGIGVSPDRHEEIFESFRQADTTTTRRFGGTGLGLTICRNLARAMGGDVRVDSTEGGGATFTLSLPLREPAVVEPAPVAQPALGTLVVERNPIARAKLRALVEPAAGPVEAVGELDAALAVIAERRPSRILIDDAVLGTAENAPGYVLRLSAAAGEARLVILRRADGARRAALMDAGAHLVLDRPITRAALAAALDTRVRQFASEPEPSVVVTRAA